MMEFLAHLVITSALLMLVANFVRGISIDGFGSALVGALVLGIVNAFVRPIMVLLTLPLTIVTLGLFLLVVNALMFWLVAAIAPGIRIVNFGSAFLGALLLAILNWLISLIAGPSL